MDHTQNTENTPKKCFCARCFLPVDENEKVEIDGQNFHRSCGTCCVCRTIPSKLKMFHGHVFCEECFKTFVLAKLRGDNPQVQVNSWWMQFAPGAKAQENAGETPKPAEPEAKSACQDESRTGPSPEAKPCCCARCLQAVNEADKVEIGGQTFHCNCARCCSCNEVPKDSIKFYFGQAFCEECFHRHVLNRNRDNPTEFFNSCFEQWKNNPQFVEHMKMFMETNGVHSPMVFMSPPPSFSVEAEREAAATPATLEDSSVWDLTIENRTDASCPESQIPSAAAEKIEKLTKYLRKTSSINMETPKKWKIVGDSLSSLKSANWMKLQQPGVPSKLTCPKCLWQYGTIIVDRD